MKKATDITYKTGCKLRDLRKSRKLSQQDAQLLTGIHQSDISRLENGLWNISLNNLKRLANCYGYDVVIEFERKRG